MPINWGEILSTGITTAGKYLLGREELRTQREIAKHQRGAGMGLETIMALLTMGASMGRGASQPPQVSQPRYYYPQGGMRAPGFFPPTGPTIPPAQPAPSTPMIPPSVGGVDPMIPVRYMGAQTAPYVQAGAERQLQPYGQFGVMIPPFAGGMTGGGIISAPEVFNPTMGGYRAKRFFAVPNPMTGNLSWFRNAGRPILFSGDLTACKRVNKVASRARRASPRKRATRRRR